MKYTDAQISEAIRLWKIDRETSDIRNRGKYSAREIEELTGVGRDMVWMVAKNQRRVSHDR